jgi:hypothetical protein
MAVPASCSTGWRFLVFALLSATAGCTREARPPARPEVVPLSIRAHDSVEGRPFPDGTVGAAINGYRLDMRGVRRWYVVIGALEEVAARDTSYHLRLNMDLSSPIAPYLTVIESDPVLRRTLATQVMTARDFILLTATINMGRATLQRTDSLGEKGRFTNLGPEIADFFHTNRRVIDSLERALP